MTLVQVADGEGTDMLKGFVGGIQQFQNEKKLLRNLCNENEIELYLEIGTLWGGTAIIAALAGAKKVITIDSMDGIRWTEPDPFYPHEIVTKERILRNFQEFGIEDRVELVHAKSFPFPVKDIYPDITLIDGGHGGDVIDDWESVKDITKKIILFHDYKRGDLPMVAHVVNVLVRDDEDWEHVGIVDSTAIIKRKDCIMIK